MGVGYPLNSSALLVPLGGSRSKAVFLAIAGFGACRECGFATVTRVFACDRSLARRRGGCRLPLEGLGVAVVLGRGRLAPGGRRRFPIAQRAIAIGGVSRFSAGMGTVFVGVQTVAIGAFRRAVSEAGRRCRPCATRGT